jgi:hypothetical protein
MMLNTNSECENAHVQRVSRRVVCQWPVVLVANADAVAE